MADDLGGTAPGVLDQPPTRARAPDQPQRDPLAAGGIPPELSDRMLKDAEALTQRQDQFMRDEAAAAKNRPAVPTVESGKLGKVPPAPQNDIRGDAMAWIGFATVLGGVAGAMTKRSSMNALAAFSGTLEGLQQGNQQKFDNNFKTWEANAKATQENNKTEMDGYRSILERQDLDHRQRVDQLEMWATMNRNKFMIDLARYAKETGDMSLFASSLDSMDVKFRQGENAVGRLVEARERARASQQERLGYARQQREDKNEEYRQEIRDILPEIASGRQSPRLTGLYGDKRLLAQQEAAKMGINLEQLALQERTAEALTRTLNSQQRATMFAYGDRFLRTTERVRDLAGQLNLDSMPVLNWGKLTALAQGSGPQSQLAARYLDQVKNAQEELSVLMRAGYAPTNLTLEFSNNQIDENQNVKNLQAQIDEEQKVVEFTMNAFSRQGAGVLGPTVPNVYTGGNAPITPPTAGPQAPAFTGRSATNPQTGQKLRETTDGQWVQ